MAKNRIKSNQIDWSTFSKNIKSQKSTSTASPVNGTDNNFAGAGCSITFTVETACFALVTAIVGMRSTTDFELKPQIWLDGTMYSLNDIGASVNGTTSNRAFQRSHMVTVPLSAGAHTISAGAYIAAASNQSVLAGEAVISAVVLGNVTA